MWTGLIFLNLLGALHCTVSSSPPSPINVIFSSVNLKNVLQWFPGSGTPDDTHFIVQYAIYGESVEGSEGRRVHWRKVRRCTEIVRSWCDLSNETKDLEQGYYARVRAVSRRASSKWVLTGRRFDPKTDTSFGPPLVSVEIEDNNAIITLKGPMRYPPNNHTQAVFMQTLYPHMIYNLSIVNTRRRHIHHSLMDSHSYKFRLMEYNTEYCFSAKTSFLYMPAHCLSSAWHCITTPQDPVIGQLQRVVVAIIVPSVCICMMVVVGYLLYRYLSGKGQKSPYILNPPAFHQTSLTFPPEKPKLLVITIIKDLHPDPEAPPPGYAFQRPQTPPALEEPWDDLSVDYGFTAAAPNLDARGEDRNNTKVQHEKCAAYEKKGWKVEEVAGHTQTHAPLLPFQAAAMGEEKEFPGIFINTTPKTGLLHIPLNRQTKLGGMGKEMVVKVRARTDGEINGGVEERSESEVFPLLSTYAFQNTMSASDVLPDDYGVLRIATAHNIEEDEEEEEQGTICIDWDPQTRTLVLPEIWMQFNKEGGLDGLVQGEKGRENRMGGEEEEEEVNLMRGELSLENVFVRQGSEEKAEAQREKERGEDTDDFLPGWNLVISMDQ